MRTTVNKSILMAAIAAALLAGCAGKDSENNLQGKALDNAPNASSLPSWVLQPIHPNALTTTACVVATGDLGLDVERADLQATAELGSMIGIQIQSLQESYNRATNTGDQIATGGNFESVVRGVVNEKLIAAHRVQGDYITVNNKQHFCSQVALGDKAVNDLVDRVASISQAELKGVSRAVSREQYLSQEALNRLDNNIRQLAQ